jgi:type IV secretory pathway TrbF-like protein
MRAPLTLAEIALRNVRLTTYVVIVSALSIFGPNPTITAQDKDKTVRVLGHGVNVSEARQDAIRQALQETMKQLVVVDRAVSADAIIRDKVLSTMNGYVEHFSEIKIVKEDGNVTVEADVTVCNCSPCLWEWLSGEG